MSNSVELKRKVTSLFKELTDTPNSYSGQGYKTVRVNNNEDALEFIVTEGLLEIDKNGDFMPVDSVPAKYFSLDNNGDLIPPDVPNYEDLDQFYELDLNGDIMPKA